MAGRHAAFAPDFRDSTLYAQDPAGSGVWEHSRDRESDLMKRWVVEERVRVGWLAVASYDDSSDAYRHAVRIEKGGTWARMHDQFRGGF